MYFRILLCFFMFLAECGALHGGGAIDLEELIMFLQASTPHVLAAVSNWNEASTRSRSQAWVKEYWREQQECRGGSAPLSQPSRMLRCFGIF